MKKKNGTDIPRKKYISKCYSVVETSYVLIVFILFTLFSLTKSFVWEKTVCVELKYLGDIFIFDSHLDKHFLENRFARKQFDGEKNNFDQILDIQRCYFFQVHSIDGFFVFLLDNFMVLQKMQEVLSFT